MIKFVCFFLFLYYQAFRYGDMYKISFFHLFFCLAINFLVVLFKQRDLLRIVILISDMAPPPPDPADFSKFRSVEPINTDPNAPPITTGEKLKRNFDMFVEVSKNRPLGETLCLKEALIFGKILFIKNFE